MWEKYDKWDRSSQEENEQKLYTFDQESTWVRTLKGVWLDKYSVLLF